MKNLKYIKLFEAFKSEKLSKTLGYIKSGKPTFLENVKSILSSIDFPFSEISDEYFEYLPFNKALKKADTLTDEPCDATSKEAFPGYAVKGAKCEGGKMKRKWGERERVVECPFCGGTGVKPKNTGDVKLVKFWFSKDGDYITLTAVDGVIRGEKVNKELSKELDPYTWNVNFHIRHGNITTGTRNIKDSIKEANFALVLDFSKLKKSVFKNKSEIRTEREEIKKGAFLTDEEIRNQNIERYFDEISKSMDIVSDVSNVNKLVSRLLMFKYALFVIVNGRVKDILSSLITRYYELMRTTDDDYRKDYIKRISDYVESAISTIKHSNLHQNINFVEKRLKEKGAEKHLILLKELMNISEMIYDKVKSINVETIEDLEVINQKLISIYNIFETSRYKISILKSFLDSAYSSSEKRAYDRFYGYGYNGLNDEEVDDVLSEIDRVKRVISKI